MTSEVMWRARRGSATSRPGMLKRVWIARGDDPVGPRPGVLVHRAWRDDVSPRFVVVGDGAPPPGAQPYERVRDEGDVDGSGGTVVVTAYDTDPGDDEAFLAAWEAACAALAGQQGRLGTRLLRGPAPWRHVELTRWSSPLMVARAGGRPDVPPLPVPVAVAAYEALRA